MTFDLPTLATAYRLPDEALPEFYRWARDKEHPESLGPVCWEVTYYRPTGWAVMDGKSVLGREGGWAYQPLPSSRSDEFKRLYRWPTADVAMEAACIAARFYPNGHPYSNDPPWGLHAQWERLWTRYHEETALHVLLLAQRLNLI